MYVQPDPVVGSNATFQVSVSTTRNQQLKRTFTIENQLLLTVFKV